MPRFFGWMHVWSLCRRAWKPAVLALVFLWSSAAASRAQDAQAAGRVLYVQAEAIGIADGSSWLDAYTDLQAALAAAESGDEIWVAKGTYKPTSGTDRAVSFVLREGVGLYGGFAGVETARSQRNWNANLTVLSGDIGVAGSAADNTYQVVIGADNAVLDGFTITGGNAPVPRTGAGMYNKNASPTVANCKFIGNTAGFAGGMYNEDSFPRITSCVFQNNTANSGAGGGMYNLRSSPILAGCVFSGNTASGSGGGIYNLNSSPTITHSTFTSNTSSTSGGAIYTHSGSPVLTECVFNGNASVRGGAVFNIFSSPVETGCVFSGNLAQYGGGIFNSGGASTMTDCVFTANRVYYYGGAVYNASCAQSATNCVFNRNQADLHGAGMYNVNSPLQIIHSVFFGNTAAYNGGAMYNESGSPTAINSIFWNNTATLGAEMHNAGGSPGFRHCNIRGSGGSGVSWNLSVGTDNGGNIAADPRFVASNAPAGADGVWRTSDDGLRLRSDSPCVGAADADLAPEKDILGFQRKETPDIGPYEFEGVPPPPPPPPSRAHPAWRVFE